MARGRRTNLESFDGAIPASAQDGVNALDDQVMDFDALVEGDLAQGFVRPVLAILAQGPERRAQADQGEVRDSRQVANVPRRLSPWLTQASCGMIWRA